MPFLTVLGNGSWTGDAVKREDGNGIRLVKFGPGIHEVDEEMAERARKARSRGVKMLMVTEYKPEITTTADRETGGGLKPEDLKRPGERGVRIKRDDGGTNVEPEPGREVLAMEYPCPHCTESFPHPAPLEIHIEVHHDVPMEALAEYEPETEGEPELPGTGLGPRDGL